MNLLVGNPLGLIDKLPTLQYQLMRPSHIKIMKRIGTTIFQMSLSCDKNTTKASLYSSVMTDNIVKLVATLRI